MEKYKLIKEYPGSPILDTIIEFKNGKCYAHFKPKLTDDDELNSIGDSEILNYKEFWKEIIKKDYEILSYYDNVNDKYYKPNSQLKDCWCACDGKKPFYKEEQLHLCKIYSIKRLSDGEIFTVSDDTNLGKIEEFNITNHHSILNIKIFGISTHGWYNLSRINHKFKQPLFITEDGVSIFENDTFYYVDQYWQIGVGICNNLIFNKLKDYKEFSTKERAQEYIYNNKPKYSVNDIKDAYFHKSGNTIFDLLDKLRQFK